MMYKTIWFFLRSQAIILLFLLPEIKAEDNGENLNIESAAIEKNKPGVTNDINEEISRNEKESKEANNQDKIPFNTTTSSEENDSKGINNIEEKGKDEVHPDEKRLTRPNNSRVSSQDPPITTFTKLRVLVVDELNDNDPIPGARVIIRDGIRVIHEKETKTNGRISEFEVPHGEVGIIVRKNGYSKFFQEYQLDQKEQSIIISLTKDLD